MRRVVYFGMFITLTLMASGCAGTIPTDTYIPQNYVRYENQNEVDMGVFTYIPLTNTKLKLKPNQVQNTALGSIYISTDVAGLVKRATALELEKSGFLLKDSSNITIAGDILELKADDLGYSVHWTYKIRYKIQNKETNKLLFSREYHPPMKKTGKFGLPSDFAPVIYEVILDGYDMFVRDSEVKALFDNAPKTAK